MRRAVAAAREGRDAKETGYGTYFLGWALALRGDLAEARHQFTQSLEIADRVGESLLRANSLGSLVMMAVSSHDVGTVRDLAPRAVAAAQALGCNYVSWGIAPLAWLAWQEGRPTTWSASRRRRMPPTRGRPAAATGTGGCTYCRSPPCTWPDRTLAGRWPPSGLCWIPASRHCPTSLRRRWRRPAARGTAGNAAMWWRAFKRPWASLATWDSSDCRHGPSGGAPAWCELGFCCGISTVTGTISGVLLSLVYRLVRCLVGLLAVLVRSDLSKDVELLVLRHENQVLSRQLGPAAGGIMPTGSGLRRCRGW